LNLNHDFSGVFGIKKKEKEKVKSKKNLKMIIKQQLFKIWSSFISKN